MKVLGLIPARMGSSRFFGKPLKEINGIPMIGHCYYRSLLSGLLDDLYVATCDKDIEEYINSINGNVVMTSDKHFRATDRVEEAWEKISKELDKDYDLIVMIQGDEPMITPEMIDAAIRPFKDPEIGVVNLMAQMQTYSELADPNEIKVAVNLEGDAIYFSRLPIPSFKEIDFDIENPWYKQVCIIPFRPQKLMEFSQLEESPLERFESIDMLRYIENGINVRMILTDLETYSVDCQEDLDHVSELMLHDELVSKYQE